MWEKNNSSFENSICVQYLAQQGLTSAASKSNLSNVKCGWSTSKPNLEGFMKYYADSEVIHHPNSKDWCCEHGSSLI